MKGIITRASIDKVRESVDIADVISSYLTLKPSGTNSLKGICPFHNEKTPSFVVSSSRGFWHCFGCGESGDVFKFLEKTDGFAFHEAVEYLADRYNIALEYDNAHGSGRKEENTVTRYRIVEANKIAKEFYCKNLYSQSGKAARDYLLKRGFKKEDWAIFDIGYAPAGWNTLLTYMQNKGFSREELEAAGLCVVSSKTTNDFQSAQNNLNAGLFGSPKDNSQSRNQINKNSAGTSQNSGTEQNSGMRYGVRGDFSHSSMYDRFRERLIFPIHDMSGDCIGFGARKLFEHDKGPKYLNTPETKVYKKASVLYGLNLAKDSVRKENKVVIVEGYTDVMAMHLSGITTAVASCGTAYGSGHTNIIRRIMHSGSNTANDLLDEKYRSNGRIIFTFDGDEAGQKAARKAFKQTEFFTGQSYVALIEDGMDPCELRLEKGDEALRRAVENAKPMYDFAIESVVKTFSLDNVQTQVEAVRAACSIIEKIADFPTKEQYKEDLPKFFINVKSELVHKVVNDFFNTSSRGNARRDFDRGDTYGAGHGYGRSGDNPGRNGGYSRGNSGHGAGYDRDNVGYNAGYDRFADNAGYDRSSYDPANRYNSHTDSGNSYNAEGKPDGNINSPRVESIPSFASRGFVRNSQIELTQFIEALIKTENFKKNRFSDVLVFLISFPEHVNKAFLSLAGENAFEDANEYFQTLYKIIYGLLSESEYIDAKKWSVLLFNEIQRFFDINESMEEIEGDEQSASLVNGGSEGDTQEPSDLEKYNFYKKLTEILSVTELPVSNETEAIEYGNELIRELSKLFIQKRIKALETRIRELSNAGDGDDNKQEIRELQKEIAELIRQKKSV